MKIQLMDVTLLGIDCINVERLQKAVDISVQDIEFGEVKLLTSLETADSRKVSIPHIASNAEYSSFCIHELFKYVNTEFVLLIQHDGFVLNSKAWTNKFLQFDYIGATWSKGLIVEYIRMNGFSENDFGKRVVGNGGFSLRSRKLLEILPELAQQGAAGRLYPEDVVICISNRKLLEARGIRFAPLRLAARFSIEGGTYKNQFGFHNYQITNISKWRKNHPVQGIDFPMEKMIKK